MVSQGARVLLWGLPLIELKGVAGVVGGAVGELGVRCIVLQGAVARGGVVGERGLRFVSYFVCGLFCYI